MYEFDKCLVMSRSGTKLAEGYIQEFDQDKDKMRIAVNGDFSLFAKQEVTVFVYNQVKGECVFAAKVLNLEVKHIVFNNIKLVRSVQKRDNTRVSKVLHYKVTHKFEDDGKEKFKIDHPLEITILNVSAQGLYLSCLEKFHMGYRFPLVFRELGKPIELIIEVVRCEDYNGSYNYGCKFVEISQKDMDNIFRFVLHEQIEQRRHNIKY